MEDAFLTITNMDKGFLYNLKMLFLNPKAITIDYVLGKRRGVLNPISFLIFSVTVYLIVESLLKKPVEPTEIQNLPKAYIGKVAYAVGKYVHTYFKYFWIVSIVPLALSTKLFFHKYNFIEHLAINSFILGQATLLGLICYVILKINMIVNPLVYVFIGWLLYRVFMIEKNKLEIFFKSFGTVVLFALQVGVIALGIGMIMV